MLRANDSAVHMEAMASGSPACYFHIVESLKSYVSLGSTGHDVGFIKPVESTLLGLIEDVAGQLSILLCSKPEGVELADPRDDLCLLSLVIKH